MEATKINKVRVADFKVGQLAYLELTGNAKREKKKEELIQECVIEAVGRKYVRARGRKFEEHDAYNGLKEHTSYSIDYLLYPTKEVIQNKLEKEELLSEIKNFFSHGGNELSLEQLKEIKNLIYVEDECEYAKDDGHDECMECQCCDWAKSNNDECGNCRTCNGGLHQMWDNSCKKHIPYWCRV